MKKWRGLIFGTAAAALLFGAAPLRAQSLTGTVTDSGSVRPLEGALVSVLGTNKRVATSASGRYSFPSLAAGSYTVRVQMIGFGLQEKTIALAADEDATLDFSIILKPIEQWKTAKTKEELIEAFDKKLKDVPGVVYNFTQPLAT